MLRSPRLPRLVAAIVVAMIAVASVITFAFTALARRRISDARAADVTSRH